MTPATTTGASMRHCGTPECPRIRGHLGFRGRRAVEQRHQKQRQQADAAGQQHHRPPAERYGDPRLDEQPERDAERPGGQDDGHRQHDLAACEPVRRHLGQHQVEQRGAHAARKPTAECDGITVRHAHDAAAGSHQRETDGAEVLVAETTDDQPARQRQNDAADVIQPDQRAEFGKPHMQFAQQQRRGGRDRLVLEPHRGARDEQHRKDQPPPVHVSVMRERTRPRARP